MRRCAKLSLDLVDLLDHHRDEQVRLRREIPVQGADGHAGALGDLVHLDALEILLGRPARAAASSIRTWRARCSSELGSAASRASAILGTVDPLTCASVHRESDTPECSHPARNSRCLPLSGIYAVPSGGHLRLRATPTRPMEEQRCRTGPSECDVVVVGSGGGALTGAYTAAAQGLSTIVLEKTDLFGGTSSYSGASIWLPGTQVQERAGLQDSTEKARTYLRPGRRRRDASGRTPTSTPPPPSSLYSSRTRTSSSSTAPSPTTTRPRVGWTPGRSINPLDLDPADIGDLAGKVRPELDQDRTGQGHAPGMLIGGRALIGRLLAAVQGTGNAELRTGTALTELVVEDGRVVGVVAEANGERDPRSRPTAVSCWRPAASKATPRCASRPAPPARRTGAWARSAPTPATAIAAGCRGRRRHRAARSGVVLPRRRAARRLSAHSWSAFAAASSSTRAERYLNESLPYDQFGRGYAMMAHRGDREYGPCPSRRT